MEEASGQVREAMASDSWTYDGDCGNADVLLKEVLEPSRVQERPIVPAVAQLLEKHGGSDETLPRLYLSPSQESTQEESAIESRSADDSCVSVDDGRLWQEGSSHVVAERPEKHGGSEDALPGRLDLSPSPEGAQRQTAVEPHSLHEGCVSADEAWVSAEEACVSADEACVSVESSLAGMQSLHLHLRRNSSDEEEETSFGPQRAGTSGSQPNDTDEEADDCLERTMGQPFFTQPDDVPSTLERLLEDDGGAQIFLPDESTSDSVESILDADGYIKQPPRRVFSYKPGRSSVMVGNTGARERKPQRKASSALPRKRTAEVDVASLLGEIPDPQSIEWTRSMESSPSGTPPRSMDLFDDSDD